MRNLRAEIAQMERTAETYRADWRLRERLPALRDELRAARARLADLLAQREAAAERVRLDWRRWLVIGLQLAAILVAQLAAVLAINRLFASGPRTRERASELRSRADGVTVREHAELFANAPEQPAEIPREPAPEPRSRANDTDPKQALRAYARRHGLRTQRQVADHLGVAPSTLSEWANGKPVAAETSEHIHRKLNGGSR